MVHEVLRTGVPFTITELSLRDSFCDASWWRGVIFRYYPQWGSANSKASWYEALSYKINDECVDTDVEENITCFLDSFQYELVEPRGGNE